MRRARAAIAAAVLAAALPAFDAVPAAAHPIAHPGPPRVRNLRPAFGEVVAPGATQLAAQVVSDVAITAHTLRVDGQPVASRVEGTDASHPTIVADVSLGPGDHVAQLDVTGSDGRTGGRAWRFTVGSVPVRRLAGADRFGTAVAISQDQYPAAGSAHGAVLARADAFADALAGGPLAAAVDGPVLLATRDALPPATRDELARAVAPGSTVYLLGGTGALSPAVESAVAAAGFVPKRLAGADRFATAAAAAAELPSPTGAIVVSGVSFPDALAASAAAVARRVPILLVGPDRVPDATAAALAAMTPATVWIAGGEGAVWPATADRVAEAAGVTPRRVAGGDRFATAVELARAFFPAGAPAAVANGFDWPDALAGGRRAGALAGPLLLTAPRLLTGPDAIASLAPASIALLGGTAAVSDGVERTLRAVRADAGAPHPVALDPGPGAEVQSLPPFTITFDRALVTAESNVYVTMGGEEVPGTIAAGDFADTLVFTPGEIPVHPPLAEPVEVRVVVAAFDGTAWRHADWRLTYRKLDMTRGDSGPAVLDLQRRLASLGYWLGTPDGVYGLLTQQAVYAFQKVHGLPRTGSVGPATRAALASPQRFAPRAGGNHVELDKARQVVVVVRDGQPVWILNTSTGTEQPYVYDGVTYLADTPTGTFTIFREIDGIRDGNLGRLYRPKYFTSDGIAFHGSSSVPPYPASHGCARLTNAAMDWVWANGIMPLGTRVLVY